MLNHQRSKFSYITYPFFGLYYVPEVTVQFDKICAELKSRQAVAKVNNSPNYLGELLSLDELEKNSRIKFNITAQSTQELIMLPKRCVWGIDITGRMHNLSRYQEFDHISIKPYLITKNKYIWFKKVTRPVVAPLSLVNIEEDILHYWFNFVYIDYVWELFKISDDYNWKATEWL
jgi:hypothetical protein